jgi:glycosyltransferase involved in cell wall biosynthesis
MALLSFVLPAFNEQENISPVFERIKGLMLKFSSLNFEVIFVNDGSYDLSIDVLKKLAVENKNVKVINFSRNFGHQTALWAGLYHSSGDAIISMDCDLQDPPEVIEKMIVNWKNGDKIVYARRINYRNDNFLKKIGTKIYYKVLDRFSNVEIPHNVGDFRLIDKAVLKILNKMKERNKYIRGMVAWTGFKSSIVEYYRPDREKGVSHYTVFKLFGLAVNGLVGFSYIPLKLGLLMGTLSIIVGSGLLTYQVFDAIINNAYYHLYKWLIVVLFIFMGFMFILMWIFGEYIARIHDEVRFRPAFVVESKLNFDEHFIS